jgi:hypothetical protein
MMRRFSGTDSHPEAGYEMHIRERGKARLTDLGRRLKGYKHPNGVWGNLLGMTEH